MKMNVEGKRSRSRSKIDGWIRLRMIWMFLVRLFVCVRDVEDWDKWRSRTREAESTIILHINFILLTGTGVKILSCFSIFWKILTIRFWIRTRQMSKVNHLSLKLTFQSYYIFLEGLYYVLDEEILLVNEVFTEKKRKKRFKQNMFLW